MKKLRVLVLVHEDLVPPSTIEGMTDKDMAPWKAEYDVAVTLEELGHQVRVVGIGNDLGVVRDAINEFEPNIVFNMLEEFGGLGTFMPYVLGYLELLGQAYTGCNPVGLMLAYNKAITKKILRFHRIPLPQFAVFPRGRTVKAPAKLSFPAIVKSDTEHGSVGISQASVVYDEKKLIERVNFIHEQLHTDAIAEQYIDGRELYVGVMGNHRLQTFPTWELMFDGLPEGVPRIATEKVKWDLSYQERAKIRTQAATDISEPIVRVIHRIAKRVYRILGQSGYARLDFRLSPEGEVFLLESNPKPHLAYGEDFAESAHACGIEYDQLVQRIVNLGMRYHKRDPRAVLTT